MAPAWIQVQFLCGAIYQGLGLPDSPQQPVAVFSSPCSAFLSCSLSLLLSSSEFISTTRRSDGQQLFLPPCQTYLELFSRSGCSSRAAFFLQTHPKVCSIMGLSPWRYQIVNQRSFHGAEAGFCSDVEHRTSNVNSCSLSFIRSS